MVANTHLNLIIPSCGSFWAGTTWGGRNWNYASTKGCFNPPTPPLSQQSGETEWVKVQQETNADSCNKFENPQCHFFNFCATNTVLSFSNRSNLFVYRRYATICYITCDKWKRSEDRSLIFRHPFWRLPMGRSVMGFPCPSGVFLHVSRKMKRQ